MKVYLAWLLGDLGHPDLLLGIYSSMDKANERISREDEWLGCYVEVVEVDDDDLVK